MTVNTPTTNVLIMAGGTGGHIFPALAVAEILQQQGANIQWLGTKKGMESRIVPEHHYAMNFIDIGGLRGKGIKTLALLPFKLSRAILQTFKVYQQVKPDVILGMGGFVTGPGGLVAWILRKPLILHEQNAIAGMTNKILYRLSKKVFAAFPGAFPKNYNLKKLSIIGNPVRKEIVDLIEPQKYYQQSWFDSQETVLNILVVGGSLGAAALNKVVPQALQIVEQKKAEQKNKGELTQGFHQIIVRHQCGEKNLVETQQYYHQLNAELNKQTGQKKSAIEVELMTFINDMAANYQWADLIICRAGALTISEVAAAGIASILVPFPYAVDDHQTANAHYLSNKGAAFLIQQRDLNKEKLAELIENLDKETIFDMACKARKLAINNAADVVANTCLQQVR